MQWFQWSDFEGRKNNIETFKNKSSILQLILNYKIAFII